jgi:transcriptional regulator with XRE-family HTH domain
MKLTQKDVADQFGVVSWTILNWEKGHTKPPIKSITAITRFLGYDPFPKPKTLSQHLLAKRRAMGWTIKKAARALGVDSASLSHWERGQTILNRQHQTRVARLLDISAGALDQVMASRRDRSHEGTI